MNKQRNRTEPKHGTMAHLLVALSIRCCVNIQNDCGPNKANDPRAAFSIWQSAKCHFEGHSQWTFLFANFNANLN